MIYLKQKTKFKHKQQEWNIVFWITSIIYAIGFLIYILFADVKLQPWAQASKSNEKSVNLMNESSNDDKHVEKPLLLLTNENN